MDLRKKSKKNPDNSDDALTKTMIGYASTLFNSPYFVTKLPVYPLWFITT